MVDRPNLIRSGCSLNSNPHFHADGVAALRTRTRIFMLDRACLYHHTAYHQDSKILCLVTPYTQLPILSRSYFDTVSSLLLCKCMKLCICDAMGRCSFLEYPTLCICIFTYAVDSLGYQMCSYFL